MNAAEKAAIDRIEARMQPGALSQGGFLGPGERLCDVVSSDRAELESLGVNQVELGDKLAALLESSLSGNGRALGIAPYRILLRQHKGSQRCPYIDDPIGPRCAPTHAWLGSVDWRIRNLATGDEQSGPGLIAHLIREHCFFEGPKSPYRVEPRALVRLLDLGPYGADRR